MPEAKKDPNSEIRTAGCRVLAVVSGRPARWRANRSNSLRSDPCISPACVDTMQNAKLCISLDLGVTLLFAHSICPPPSLILFTSRHLAAYCPQTGERFTGNCLLELRNLFFRDVRESRHAWCQTLRQSRSR